MDVQRQAWNHRGSGKRDAKNPEFEGKVAGVETREFQRSPEESPSKQEFHWMRNWETYFLIGDGMAEALLGLESDDP